MASEAADGKPIGHHFAEWWNGVQGRRSAREKGWKPSKKCLRGNLGNVVCHQFVTTVSC
jgi:hypothetical protein